MFGDNSIAQPPPDSPAKTMQLRFRGRYVQHVRESRQSIAKMLRFLGGVGEYYHTIWGIRFDKVPIYWYCSCLRFASAFPVRLSVWKLGFWWACVRQGLLLYPLSEWNYLFFLILTSFSDWTSKVNQWKDRRQSSKLKSKHNPVKPSKGPKLRWSFLMKKVTWEIRSRRGVKVKPTLHRTK